MGERGDMTTHQTLRACHVPGALASIIEQQMGRRGTSRAFSPEPALPEPSASDPSTVTKKAKKKHLDGQTVAQDGATVERWRRAAN